MATNAKAKATTTTTTTAHSGPYRTNAAWFAAHGAAVAHHRGNANAKASLTVATHLAWRAPAGAVAWHKGTNAAMLAHAASLGIATGQPVHAAMALVVASLPNHATTAALAKATATLAPAAK